MTSVFLPQYLLAREQPRMIYQVITYAPTSEMSLHMKVRPLYLYTFLD